MVSVKYVLVGPYLLNERDRAISLLEVNVNAAIVRLDVISIQHQLTPVVSDKEIKLIYSAQIMYRE